MSKSTAYAWLGTFATNVLVLLCGIATGILSARLLLPEGRGVLAAVLFWPQIAASIGLLNLHTAIAQRASQDSADVKKIVVTSICLALCLAGITALLTCFLLPYLLGSERAQWLTLARNYLVAFLPFNFVGLSLLAVDQAKLHFTRYNLFRLLAPATYLCGLLALWAFNAVTVENVLWVNWAGAFLVSVVMVATNKQFGTYPCWKEAKKLLRISVRLQLATSLILVASQMDRVAIMTLMDNEAIGLYTVAFTFAASGLSILTTSFQAILFPKLARTDDVTTQREILAKGLRYVMLLIVVGSLPLMSLSPWLIPFLFGKEFKAAVVPAMILFVVYVPMAMQQVIVQSLYSLNQPRPTAVNAVVTSCVFFLTSWPLGVRFGLVGILLALLLANLVGLYYLLSYLRQQLGLLPKDWWGLNWQTVIQVIDLARVLLNRRTATG